MCPEEYRLKRENVEIVQLAFQLPQNNETSPNHKFKFHKGNKSHRNQQNKNFGGRTYGGPKGIIKKNDKCSSAKVRVTGKRLFLSLRLCWRRRNVPQGITSKRRPSEN